MLCIHTISHLCFGTQSVLTEVQKMLESATVRAETNYPPYNIETDNDDISSHQRSCGRFSKR